MKENDLFGALAPEVAPPVRDRAERGSRGGRARAAKLSSRRRKEIAIKAANKRWGDRKEDYAVPRVLETFKSEVNLAGTKLPCAVIKGPNGIKRVLSETGITEAVLGAGSGASFRKKKKVAQEEGVFLPLFIAPSQLDPFISDDLRHGVLKPIDYLDGERLVRGYDAEALVEVCNVWLKAREAGALQGQQLAKAQNAEILLRSLGKLGIAGLVDEVTGYQHARPQRALEQYFELLVGKELGKWAKRFPDEFYENMYRLRGWTWTGREGGNNTYSVVSYYTTDLIYSRMAPGLLDELRRKIPKNEKGKQAGRLHQMLTDDIGHPALQQHLHAVMMFMRLAIANGYGWAKFMHMVDRVMPKLNDTLLLPFEDTNFVVDALPE